MKSILDFPSEDNLGLLEILDGLEISSGVIIRILKMPSRDYLRIFKSQGSFKASFKVLSCSDIDSGSWSGHKYCTGSRPCCGHW